MGRRMKKIFSILTALSIALSLITVVHAASSADVELSGIEYVLKKGTRQVNVVTLSNKMEVQAKIKNTSKASKTIKQRIKSSKTRQNTENSLQPSTPG